MQVLYVSITVRVCIRWVCMLDLLPAVNGAMNERTVTEPSKHGNPEED